MRKVINFMYLLRLDDASEYMNTVNWDRIENLLDKYNIKPIVGIIPKNMDANLTSKFEKDSKFWCKAQMWHKKGWHIALHGYNHVYDRNDGGINPVNKQSEFAGNTLNIQKEKILNGIKVLKSKNLNPHIFFAPGHTFDKNTLIALKEETNIRIISDTISNDIYYEDGFYFIPVQSGVVRKLPFKITTFCYHPNTMEENEFDKLEDFIKVNKNKFLDLKTIEFKIRKKNLYDNLLSKLYFLRKK